MYWLNYFDYVFFQLASCDCEGKQQTAGRFRVETGERAGEIDDVSKWEKMENGSILLALQMRHILASLDSVASAADGIQRKA